ncbi:unnamed protein product [Ambrosiozyma monospora]|uniref:Unnamed protein product n=2 Tax=Ambrosiozyma monospora TaxID=43982 RepID=A0ACB5T539_AMBMO|nr:unnamed protein product [Ambrosiozyma monospora]
MGNTPSTGKKPPKVTAQDKAILQLKLQRDKLHKATIRIQTVINRETEIAKQSLKQDNKHRALLALRKKKYQQNLLTTVEKQSDTLESLINTIEFKLIEKDVLYGLQQGNTVLKQLNNEMSLEKVEKIMDDSEEGVRYQEELSERLGDLMSNSLEDEVELELQALEAEALGKKLKDEVPSVPNVPVLPDVPKEEVKENKEEEEESSSPQLVHQKQEAGPMLA